LIAAITIQSRAAMKQVTMLTTMMAERTSPIFMASSGAAPKRGLECPGAARFALWGSGATHKGESIS